MINETIGEGPFHIEDRLEGHSHLDAPYRYKVIHLFKYFEQKHFLVHSYAQNFSFRGEPLPLYPGDMEARGKVNIVIFSGQCHSQPSPSLSPSPSPGVKLRRQHWCFLALLLVVLAVCCGILLPLSTNQVLFGPSSWNWLWPSEN